MFQTQCFTLMRRSFLYTAMLFTLTLGGESRAYAQEMRDIFVDLPKHILPILPKSSREKLIETHFTQRERAKQSLPLIENALGAPSFIQTLTPSYIHVVLDKSTDVQYKRLYTEEGTVVMGMIVTSKIAPKQSIMKFYDSTWKELPTELIIARPEASDFLQNPKDSTLLVFKNAMVERGHIDTYAVFLPDEDGVIMRLSTFDDQMAQKLHPKLMALLAPEGIRYTWEMGQFKKTK